MGWVDENLFHNIRYSYLKIGRDKNVERWKINKKIYNSIDDYIVSLTFITKEVKEDKHILYYLSVDLGKDFDNSLAPISS